MTEPVTLPQLNAPAPQFTAPSTHGEISLSDYAGKWVVLFSHPADFTPVCTTEFVEFARQTDDFAAMNTQLIGLSIDSIYAHIAWMRNIEQHFGVKVKFPVIADLSMDVAHRYGMVHPGASSTATVRCVFVIDPESGQISIQEVSIIRLVGEFAVIEGDISDGATIVSRGVAFLSEGQRVSRLGVGPQRFE